MLRFVRGAYFASERYPYFDFLVRNDGGSCQMGTFGLRRGMAGVESSVVRGTSGQLRLPRRGTESTSWSAETTSLQPFIRLLSTPGNSCGLTCNEGVPGSNPGARFRETDAYEDNSKGCQGQTRRRPPPGAHHAGALTPAARWSQARRPLRSRWTGAGARCRPVTTAAGASLRVGAVRRRAGPRPSVRSARKSRPR